MYIYNMYIYIYNIYTIHGVKLNLNQHDWATTLYDFLVLHW